MTDGSSSGAEIDRHSGGRGYADLPAHAADAASGSGGVRPGRWSGYAASLWAVGFALVSVYWAAGGRLGAGTIGAAVEGPALARDPAFVALLWATAVLKILAAVLALALIGKILRWVPRTLLLLAGWGTAALLLLYGMANLVQHLLIATARIDMPAGLGPAALPWHLLLWDPVWIGGGALFALAATHSSMRPARDAA